MQNGKEKRRYFVMGKQNKENQNNIRITLEQHQNNFRTTSLPDNGMRPLQHRHTNAGLSEYAYKLQ